MGKNTTIEWARHTFSPWMGCDRLSPGCLHCYAADLRARFGHGDEWGPNGVRTKTGEANWSQPLKWDREAREAGERHTVFCASLGDVFEDRQDLDAWRNELFDLIEQTPNLLWLLLTKRPEHAVAAFRARDWIRGEHAWHNWTDSVWAGPQNVWIGTSTENQLQADLRVPYLLTIPAPGRFVSAEPLLGPVDLTEINELLQPDISPCRIRWNALTGLVSAMDEYRPWCIDWVICGGESGRKARPMHPQWARRLRDQCSAADVPFFFKQWGEWSPQTPEARLVTSESLDGVGDHDTAVPGVIVSRLGKQHAGRTLDGRTWDQFPPALAASS